MRCCARRTDTSPRDFCREPGYDKALLLTYAFDALFFERLVLPDLWAGGSTDVQVIADLGQISEAAPRWIGQTRQLGQKYRLTCALSRGAFHPKIFLRAGPEGGAVWIGSGNVTNGGWGCNLEVGTAWRVGPRLQDQGAWLKSLLGHIARWLPSGSAGTVYERILDCAWLKAADTAQQPSPVLISQTQRPLAQQLTERWPGRRFNEAVIVTGSTDEGGAALEWIHDELGVTKATVLLDPERAGFDASRIAKLQIKTHLVKPRIPRSVHAKFYWLDGVDGPAAIMGSANCSRAAWLLPPDQGGNLETVLVYDHPSKSDFTKLLSCVTPEEAEPAVLLSPKSQVIAGSQTDLGYSVAEISWDRLMGDLTVVFTKPLPAGATVTVALDANRVECHASKQGSVWFATVAFDPFPARISVFAEVAINLPGGTSLAMQRHWINDLAELRHSARARAIGDAIRALGRPHASTEQQKILAELQKIGVELLTESALFPDPPSKKTRDSSEHDEDPDATAPPVDPEKLIRSLHEENYDEKPRAAYGLHGVTLIGVMRALFELDQEESEPITGQEYDDPEGDAPPNPNSPRKKTRTNPIPDKDSFLPPERLKEKLRKEMDSFVQKFSDGQFAENCTVTQLVQAAAYPLAVMVNGVIGGWTGRKASQYWASSVFDTLFCKSYPTGRGLLAAVQKRCDSNGQAEGFKQIVGDGTLWTAILASLWRGPWTGVNGGLKKAFALRSVLTSKQLLGSADSGRMGTLVKSAERTAGLSSLVASSHSAASDLMNTENYITSNWSRLIEKQNQLRTIYETGNALYSESGGWGFVVDQTEITDGTKIRVYRQNSATSVPVKVGFYLNVTRMATVDGALFDLMERLAKYGGGVK